MGGILDLLFELNDEDVLDEAMYDEFEEAVEEVTKIHRTSFARTDFLINFFTKVTYGPRSAIYKAKKICNV